MATTISFPAHEAPITTAPLLRLNRLCSGLPARVLLKDARLRREPSQPSLAEEVWRDTNGRIDVLVLSQGAEWALAHAESSIHRRKPVFRAVKVRPPGLAEPLPAGASLALAETVEAGVGEEAPAWAAAQEVVTDEDALRTARLLAAVEGIFASIHTAANVHAALRLAALPEFAGKIIIALGFGHASTAESGPRWGVETA